MITECIINIDLVDTTAKKDSTPSVVNNSSFANVNKLKEKNSNMPDYGTLEWNYFLLDGNIPHMPNDINGVGYPIFSTELSDGEKTRVNNPDMEISFTSNHSSIGLTLSFIGDYPATVRVEWYSETLTLLESGVFHPDNSNYFLERQVENYRKIKLYFTGSLFPYRYLKIDNISYGSNLIFGQENVIKATLLEEIDTISSELSINTCDFTLFDKSKDFNVLNPTGKYSLLQSMQEINVQEKINDNLVDMGTFYLDDWDSESETQINFKTVDALGILDKTDFIKGKIYIDEPVENIINDIMASAGWDKYDVSNELKDLALSGYIPICTHRQALQQVIFAIRAVADCSRGSNIKIYRISKAIDTKIKDNRLFLSGENIKIRKYISDINITTHSYSISSETETVFEGILSVGMNEITFENPTSNLTITGGALVESGVNYAIVNMTITGECKIEGNIYIDTKSSFIKKADYIPAGEVKNSIAVKEATLINKYNAYLLAEHLFDYYNLRREAEERFIIESESPGKWVGVKSQYGLYVNGVIEKQEIDLTGGFIAKANIVGYNTLETDFIFTGIEAFTGEKIGVI